MADDANPKIWRDNLAAFTSAREYLPEFVSINRLGEEIEIQIRGAPHLVHTGGQAMILLSAETARNLFSVALERLDPQKSKAVRTHVHPSIGRVVLYRDGDLAGGFNGADETPAIITRVWSPTCVNLMVLSDGGSVFPMTSISWFDGEHIPLDRPTEPRTWRWPPRV